MEPGPAVHPRVHDQPLAARLGDRSYDEILAPGKGGDVEAGHRREGHDGARRSSTAFLGAFPDVASLLRDTTVGPQGVTEVARVQATQSDPFAGWPATGEAVSFTFVIVLPGHPATRRFRGERVLAARGATPDVAA